MADIDHLPKVQTALVGTAEGTLAISREAGMPRIEPDTVIVRSMAISVNPVDTKMVGPYVTAGAISGCDFAGTVVAAGAEADKDNIKIGDRVCGAVMGMNPLEPSVGAFASYVGAHANGLLRLPPSMSFATGAALGTSFMTAGLALFKSLALPGDPLHPSPRPIPVLVYGGSTATGTAAIQLLALAGFQPIVTCSPANFPLVESYGAAAVFDYRSPSCGADIRAHTKNGLRYALDCITTGESMQLCYTAIGRAGGRYTALDPFPDLIAQSRKAIKADWVLGPTMLGKDISWPAPHGRPADPDIRKFGLQWIATVQKLLDQGKIREHPIVVDEGGLGQVLKGMEAIRAKKISGKKLVYLMN